MVEHSHYQKYSAIPLQMAEIPQRQKLSTVFDNFNFTKSRLDGYISHKSKNSHPKFKNSHDILREKTLRGNVDRALALVVFSTNASLDIEG